MKAIVERCETVLGGFLKVEEAHVSFELTKGGMSPTVKRVNVVRNDAVAGLVVNKVRGTVVLVRQFRYSALSRGNAWLTEVVAGLIDEGETPEQAIRRETVEEVGYKTGALEEIIRFFPTPGFCSERIVLYYAETAQAEPEGNGGGLIDESEDIEIVEVPYAEAFTMLDRGEIVDGKTLIALLWLRNKLAG